MWKSNISVPFALSMRLMNYAEETAETLFCTFLHLDTWLNRFVFSWFKKFTNIKKFSCSGNEKCWVDTSHIFGEKIEKILENLAFCELAWTIQFCKSLENSTIVKRFSDWFFEMVIIWLKLKINPFSFQSSIYLLRH